ncbi:hypothetical protein [Clostridium sp. 1001283B150210_160208_E6]|uniref:hypothetical protein n=1 Tax=Clostridium sp. 1001283B150210_160208_E6 TaxID=2787129 RepID=UPI0018A89E42|nr:hypothetical protein [Clostridium sp. 1001283B150210_160208_E6]
MSNVIYYQHLLWDLGIKSARGKTTLKEEKMLIQLIRWDNEVANKNDSEYNEIY